MRRGLLAVALVTAGLSGCAVYPDGSPAYLTEGGAIGTYYGPAYPASYEIGYYGGYNGYPGGYSRSHGHGHPDYNHHSGWHGGDGPGPRGPSVGGY